ncbi:MAG TPA: hypothetical protein VKB28_09655 [Solirubrobacteraceae bacterium]|nr:hypothetical protein [Solirubrobacteraceae bacterium]
MPPEPSPARPPRRWYARLLILLASVLAFLALHAIWLDRQLLNTDNWAASSSELLAQPAVRNQAAAFLTDELYENVDIEAEIRSALPPRAQVLAQPAASLLRDRVELRARKLLQRPRVQTLWEDANRAAHQMLMRVLDGGGTAVSTQNGTVVLDLKTLLAQLEAQTGIGGRVGAALPASAAQITVLKSDQLDTAQDAAKIIDGLPILLVGLSLALFAAALLVAPAYRRRTVRGYGIGLLAAGAGAIAATAWAGDYVVGSLSNTAATEPVVRAVWDVYDSLLVQAATAAIFYGAVMVGGAWLAGPTAWAVGLRRAVAPYLAQPALAYGVFAAVLFVVVVWWSPTPAMRNPVTAILLAGLLALGFEALRRKTRREFPSPLVSQAAPFAGEAENGETVRPHTPESVG